MFVRLPQRRRRLAGVVALAGAALTIAALLASSLDAASGAGNDPSMEVLPGTTGLKYGQTVEIKGHHLPKGSGNVAATICGLTDAAGKAIAAPSADDCAGAESLGTLVVLKAWGSDGEFDTQYTLPASNQQFGKNKRACDATHYCALVVADGNPDKPAYNIPTAIFFTDQQAPTEPTPTTAPSGSQTTVPGSSVPAGTTPGTTGPGAPPTTVGNNGPAESVGGAHGSVSGRVSLDPSNPGGQFDGIVSIAPPRGGGDTPVLPTPTLPSVPTPTLPAQAADALSQVCGQLAAAVTQAGGDATVLNTACTAVANGTGPAQLQLILANPTLLCLAAQSSWQNNPQVTAACNQAAAALAPATGLLGGFIPHS
jgi:hypothetical protein